MTGLVDLGILSPDNDLDVWFVLEDINTSTGTRTPITTGTVTGKLVTSPTSDTEAHADFSVSGFYVGGNPKVSGQNGNWPAGTWMFHIDASVLTSAQLTAYFQSATPYFVARKSNAVRKVGVLTYQPYSTGTAG